MADLPESWGSAEFEVLSDTYNEECRIVDVKLTGEIRGEWCEMVQRLVFPITIMKAEQNYDMLAEVLTYNVLYSWVESIIRKQDDAMEGL